MHNPLGNMDRWQAWRMVYGHQCETNRPAPTAWTCRSPYAATSVTPVPMYFGSGNPVSQPVCTRKP